MQQKQTSAQLAFESRVVPVEDLADDVSTVAEAVRKGHAYLRAVAYPWGVEFDLVPGGSLP